MCVVSFPPPHFYSFGDRLTPNDMPYHGTNEVQLYDVENDNGYDDGDNDCLVQNQHAVYEINVLYLWKQHIISHPATTTTLLSCFK